jgi:hypothetical protein
MAEERSSQADTGSTHWAHRLGEKRHDRDECAVRTATFEAEGAARLNAVSLERWQAIVDGIRRLADAYNAGAKRVCLTVLEQSGQPAVTVAAAGEGTQYLTAVLEDTLICIRGCDSEGVAHATEIRLRPERSDDATAAYVLQDWMQRL